MTGTRNIEIQGINPAELFGVNDANFKHLKSYYPKLKVTARGHVVSISGDDEVMDEFERKFNLIIQHFNQFNSLTENNIDRILSNPPDKLIFSIDGLDETTYQNYRVGGTFEEAFAFPFTHKICCHRHTAFRNQTFL